MTPINTMTRLPAGARKRTTAAALTRREKDPMKCDESGRALKHDKCLYRTLLAAGLRVQVHKNTQRGYPFSLNANDPGSVLAVKGPLAPLHAL